MKRFERLVVERGQRLAVIGCEAEGKRQIAKFSGQSHGFLSEKSGIKLNGLRKFWIIIAIVLFQNSVHPQQNSITPGSQVITSEEIKAAGIINLSDIFSLFDKWNYSSIDGFNYTVSANMLSGYQFQNFVVMVDGQKIDLNFLNQQNINLLPFTPLQISYVEIINSPQLYDGEFTTSGLIHFHLKKPEKNLTAHFNYATGNETGDPGPYKFTKYATPNLDKINFMLAADFSYSSKNWFLRSSIKQEENFVSDERIRRRIESFSLNNDKAKSISSFGEIKINLPGSSHNLYAAYTTSNDYFYFKPVGNELPIRKVLLYGGLNGKVLISRNISMNYRLGASQKKFIDWQSVKIDFMNDMINASLFSEYKSSFINFLIGLGYDRNTASTGAKLTDKTISFKKIFSRLSFHPSDKFSYNIDGSIMKGEDELSIKSSLTSLFKINLQNSVSGLFSYSESSPDELLNYWSWFARGFSFSTNVPVSYTVPLSIGKNKLITAELLHSFHNIDSTIITEAGVIFRQHHTYLEKQNFQLVNNYFVSAVEVIPNEKLNAAGFHLGVNQKILQGLSYKLNYYYQRAISGNELFKKNWLSFPEHKFSLIVNFKPVNSFGIWARLNYLSRTEWQEFNYFEYQAQEGFSNEINRGIILDLSVQKYFGNRLIWTNLLFKNILNQKEFYHPAGANFNFRFYIQVRINLDNLPE